MATMLQYQIMGTTDERSDCDCCGRSGLKQTVCLVDLESREYVYFGTTCAAKAAKWGVKEVKQAINKAIEDNTKSTEDFVKSHPSMPRLASLREQKRSFWGRFDDEGMALQKTQRQGAEYQTLNAEISELSDIIRRDIAAFMPERFRMHVSF